MCAVAGGSNAAAVDDAVCLNEADDGFRLGVTGDEVDEDGVRREWKVKIDGG